MRITSIAKKFVRACTVIKIIILVFYSHVYITAS